ncbi:MAG: ribonucleoside-triphosphate reductase, adenosylcobalamin-dependent [bacterium]|jgi:ribonucleotide reductase class II
MNSEIFATAPAADPVFYRSYSRKKENGQRETFSEVTDRVVEGLQELGKLNQEEVNLVTEMISQKQMLPSGRWLWVGGTAWSKQKKNYSGAYNCTSTELVDWEAFGLMMDLAMMGSGTGAIIEQRFIQSLPTIRNKLIVEESVGVGVSSPENRHENSFIDYRGNTITIKVGDSRRGWVDAYQATIEAATSLEFDWMRPVTVHIDLSSVRPAGEKLHGFGGVSNPINLQALFGKLADILNGALGRRLTAVECCLLIDEAATVVVAGNIRRSAGMRQFSSDDVAAAQAKDNLWQQGADGSWSIDPKRDALRMANHTLVYHKKPSKKEILDSVTKQFYSGEGAIQFAPEAIARSNQDLLNTDERRKSFIDIYTKEGREVAASFLYAINDQLGGPLDEGELRHRMNRYGLNPCGEILGTDFHCNLSEIHLNRLDPNDFEEQERAFKAGGITAAALLHHEFEVERYRESRELDPIVGVSFTGLFDFFVHAFGANWLKWFVAGRPDTTEGKAFKATEAAYLKRWRAVVDKTVREYCVKHGLRVPNRSTTVQPAGTKSLLTGASSGWHPPKAQRFIRRITFRRDDPIALACLDYGYSVVPSQSDKDENGRLLDNPFDPRCTEWLVEIPTSVTWADIEGCDEPDISAITAAAQFDFYMQVQRHYTAHNTSATIEYREDEIEELSELIYETIKDDGGYISAALLARFDSLETFPRLPFEPISKEEYLELQAEVKRRQKNRNFFAALEEHDTDEVFEAGPAPCDSDKCLVEGMDGIAKPFSEESMFAPIHDS